MKLPDGRFEEETEEFLAEVAAHDKAQAELKQSRLEKELNEELGNINDNTPLIEIYKKYQRNISNALLHLNYSILSNIYNTHIVNDIGSQRGFRDTNYFVNFDNTEIPEEFRAQMMEQMPDGMAGACSIGWKPKEESEEDEEDEEDEPDV